MSSRDKPDGFLRHNFSTSSIKTAGLIFFNFLYSLTADLVTVQGVEISNRTILWSEKSLPILILGITFESASWMIRSRVLDSLWVGLSTLLIRLKLLSISRKIDGTASDGLLTAMLKSPSRISSLLELILDYSKLASSLQNSNALESGGLYIAMRLTALKPVLILKQVDSIVSSGWPFVMLMLRLFL